MKKITLFVMLMVMAFIPEKVISQVITLSTDNGKTCKVNIEVSQMKDNLLDVFIRPVWVTEVGLKPITDNSSVLGFSKDKIFINYPGFIKLRDSTLRSVFASNTEIKLTYEVSEKFSGGDFEFKFPFFYAANAESAKDPSQREEFTFKRPRDFALAFNIPQSSIVNKYPPALTILSPEGADEGFKKLIDTTMVRVKLLATDAAGVESVTVNNIQATRIDDSTYVADITLKSGYENPIVASATDKGGKNTKKQFSVQCTPKEIKTIAVVAPPPAPAPVVPEVILSDVDLDIPVVATPDPNKFALIIGNEDYKSFQEGLNSESNVEFAIRDAEVFKEYVVKVIGVPEGNIIFRKNAKAVEMTREINKFNFIAKTTGGKAELYVYYAGHGIPDPKSNEPYIVPVDVSGNDLQFAIKLSDFYKKLTEFPTKRITVFLDACFSGGGRDQGLVAARGVKIKPRETLLKGNIVVFAASSGEQSSLPYKEKQHGIFTYFLLKKLKETNGDISLKELSEFLSTEVGIRSAMVNSKEQNPQTNVSPSMGESWKILKIK
jgi:hypothetical protein